MSGVIWGFFTGYYGGDFDNWEVLDLNRDLLDSFLKNNGYDKQKVIEIYWRFRMNLNPLTRMMPFTFLEDYDSIAVDLSLTDGTVQQLDACTLYVRALRLLMNDVDPQSVVGMLRNDAKTTEVKDLLEYIMNGQEVAINRNDIFSTFYVAFNTLYWSQDLYDTWSDAMGSLERHDAVYTSITGALLGAHYKDVPKPQALLERYTELPEIVDLFGPYLRLYYNTLIRLAKLISSYRWDPVHNSEIYMDILFPETIPPQLVDNQTMKILVYNAVVVIFLFYGIDLKSTPPRVFDQVAFDEYIIRGGFHQQEIERMRRILHTFRLVGGDPRELVRFLMSQGPVPEHVSSIWLSE